MSYMGKKQPEQAQWAATFVATFMPDSVLYGLPEDEFDAFKELNITLSGPCRCSGSYGRRMLLQLGMACRWHIAQ